MWVFAMKVKFNETGKQLHVKTHALKKDIWCFILHDRRNQEPV